MRALLRILVFPALVAHSSWAEDSVLGEVFHHEQVLGTSLELKVFGASHDQALKAEAAALAEIDRLAKILSSYDATSEVSRWLRTRDESVALSPELGRLLRLFDFWRVQSGGALDPAAAGVSSIWREAESRQQLPSTAERARAVAAIAQPHWRLDADASHATHLSDTPLVFNSLTKSFIIERAADAAMKAAAPAGLVLNIGGDIVVRGKVREVIAIADPLSDAENATPLGRIVVTSGAVATSGNYRRGFDILGHHYSHIVDPRTGLTAEEVLSATVVAPDATAAGALATSMCVVTPDESARLAAQHGAEYLLVLRDGRRDSSPGWKNLQHTADGHPSIAAKLFAAGLLLAALPAPSAPQEGAGMELVIELELKRINDARYRRPYVAVWIEDKDKFPVRTLALWYGKPRWLPDLKIWMKGDQLRKLVDAMDLATTISSATRSAGKYTLKWDGKDDKGVPVKAGNYTIMIEAAREHGTYQLMKQEMEFTGAPKQIKLKGNAEIEGVTLDYRRKTATATRLKIMPNGWPMKPRWLKRKLTTISPI